MIFYNFFPEYLFAAIILSIIGTPAIIDIEDAPRFDELGINAFVSRITLPILKIFCVKKYLTASAIVANVVNLKDYFAVPGIAYMNARRRTISRFEKTEISVQIGGNLNEDTGIGILEDCILFLSSRANSSNIHFYITGFFDVSAISKMMLRTNNHLQISLYNNIRDKEFDDLMDHMDIGLSLRIAGRSLSATTFPSKVIDIASRGLLLVCTKAGGTQDVFSSTQACFLHDETGEALATLLMWLEFNRIEARKLALSGQQMVLESFSEENTGSRLFKYLKDI